MSDEKVINLDTCRKVKQETEITGNFTSVRGEYYIPELNTTGFFKEDGCMCSANHDESYREMLASELLEKMGVPCAKIMLAQGEKQKGCLSLSILRPDEEMIDILPYEDEQYTVDQKLKGVDWFIAADQAILSKIPGMTPEFLEERKKTLPKKFFVGALLGNADIRSVNMQPILNRRTGEFRSPEEYDYGNAFTQMRGDSFFAGVTLEEFIAQLYQNYYPEIEELSNRASQVLTKETIKETLKKPIYREGFGDHASRIGNCLSYTIGINEELNQKKAEDKELAVTPREGATIGEMGISLLNIQKIQEETDISMQDKWRIVLNGMLENVKGNER